jgi:hypothetical protein
LVSAAEGNNHCFILENPTKTINTELSAELFIIIAGSTYTYYWALKG